MGPQLLLPLLFWSVQWVHCSGLKGTDVCVVMLSKHSPDEPLSMRTVPCVLPGVHVFEADLLTVEAFHMYTQCIRDDGYSYMSYLPTYVHYFSNASTCRNTGETLESIADDNERLNIAGPSSAQAAFSMCVVLNDTVKNTPYNTTFVRCDIEPGDENQTVNVLGWCLMNAGYGAADLFEDVLGLFRTDFQLPCGSRTTPYVTKAHSTVSRCSSVALDLNLSIMLLVCCCFLAVDKLNFDLMFRLPSLVCYIQAKS